MASTVTALLDEVYDGLYDRPAHMDLQEQGGGACCARGANLRINCDPWREATPHLRVRLHCHSQLTRPVAILTSATDSSAHRSASAATSGRNRRLWPRTGVRRPCGAELCPSRAGWQRRAGRACRRADRGARSLRGLTDVQRRARERLARLECAAARRARSAGMRDRTAVLPRPNAIALLACSDVDRGGSAAPAAVHSR